MNTGNLDLALQLLIVGMLSVFFILGIVVALGRTLVFLVNKFSPDVKQKAVTRAGNTNNTGAISGKKLAVLSAVVDMVTDSKGVLKSVEKL